MLSCIIGALSCGAMHIAGPIAYAPPVVNSQWAYAAYMVPTLHRQGPIMVPSAIDPVAYRRLI